MNESSAIRKDKKMSFLAWKILRSRCIEKLLAIDVYARQRALLFGLYIFECCEDDAFENKLLSFYPHLKSNHL